MFQIEAAKGVVTGSYVTACGGEQKACKEGNRCIDGLVSDKMKRM